MSHHKNQLTPCFIVVGYNNTRIYDVRKLRRLCRQHHRAELILVNDIVSKHDDSASLHTIITSLNEQAISDSLSNVQNIIERLALKPVGVLPFSEKGLLLGAELAQYYQLNGPTPREAEIGVDKRLFRECDNDMPNPPLGYQSIPYKQVYSVPELKQLVDELGGKAFIKPAQEGNSRGCIAIHSEKDSDNAWNVVEPYVEDGVIVEALVDDAKEYSFDSVANVCWLTEKFTVDGDFSAEYQQIVPAKLSALHKALLTDAGLRIKSVTAPNYGCWHNEVFLRSDDTTCAVEPNMRPAGMRIWDLANISFKDFNPWLYWLDWAKSGKEHNLKPTVIRYSGIRMLKGKKSGRVVKLPDLTSVNTVCEQGLLHSAELYCSEGDSVIDSPVDNSQFIGHIMLSHESYEELRRMLDRIAEDIEASVEII